MANLFVRSTTGSDANNGTTWALAKATIPGAQNIGAAGDTIFVSKVHAESSGSAINMSSNGTHLAPIKVLCVDDTGDPANPTTLATTATVSTTTNIAISFNTGVTYFYGLSFLQGTAGNNANMVVGNSSVLTGLIFDNCVFSLVATGAQTLRFGTAAASADCPNLIQLWNCTIKFAAVAHLMSFARCRFEMLGGSIALTGTVPTTLIGISGVDLISNVLFDGVDLSGIGSGKNLFDAARIGSSHNFTLRNCKLGASVALTTGTRVGHGDGKIMLRNCDSGNTNYKFTDDNYDGTTSQEITIVQTVPAGATDESTPISFKMVSSANTTFYFPLRSPDIIYRQTAVGSSVVATINIINDGTTFTDAEIWMEVEYLGTSSFPLALFATDRAASILATPANQTTSTVTWANSFGSPIKQSLDVTFTPRVVGNIRCTVCVAKASATVYINPKVTVV